MPALLHVRSHQQSALPYPDENLPLKNGRLGRIRIQRGPYRTGVVYYPPSGIARERKYGVGKTLGEALGYLTSFFQLEPELKAYLEELGKFSDAVDHQLKNPLPPPPDNPDFIP